MSTAAISGAFLPLPQWRNGPEQPSAGAVEAGAAAQGEVEGVPAAAALPPWLGYPPGFPALHADAALQPYCQILLL